MDMGIEGKIAIVTGGALGLGRAISLSLAAEGAKVIIADINDDSSEEVEFRIRETKGDAISIKTDVTLEDQVQLLVERVIDEFG